MKILLIHNYYQVRGGEETYFESLAKLFRQNGHKVVIYIKNNNDLQKGFMNSINTAVGLFVNKKVEGELAALIKKERPDVSQIQNIYPFISANIYWVLKKYNIPIVQRISNYRLMCPKAILFRDGHICEDCIDKPFAYPSIIHRCYQNSHTASLALSTGLFYHNTINSINNIDVFIFPTSFIQQYYLHHFNIPSQKAHIIPTFSLMKEVPNKHREKDFFLYVGRLSEEKGILPLLGMFKSSPQIKLMVIGDGPLIKKVLEFKTCKNIIIKKHLSHKTLSQYLQGAIGTVIPSLWYDVLPNVILESLAVGTPVILPSLPSLISIIPTYKNHIFFTYNNTEELKKLLLSFKKRVDVKKNEIIQYYKETFSSQQHYLKLMELYKKLI